MQIVIGWKAAVSDFDSAMWLGLGVGGCRAKPDRWRMWWCFQCWRTRGCVKTIFFPQLAEKVPFCHIYSLNKACPKAVMKRWHAIKFSFVIGRIVILMVLPVKGWCQALSIFTWNFEQCMCLNSKLTTIIYTKGSLVYSNLTIENKPQAHIALCEANSCSSQFK